MKSGESGEDSHAVTQTINYMYAKDGSASYVCALRVIHNFPEWRPLQVGVTKMGSTCRAISRIKENMLST